MIKTNLMKLKFSKEIKIQHEPYRIKKININLEEKIKIAKNLSPNLIPKVNSYGKLSTWVNGKSADGSEENIYIPTMILIVAQRNETIRKNCNKKKYLFPKNSQ